MYLAGVSVRRGGKHHGSVVEHAGEFGHGKPPDLEGLARLFASSQDVPAGRRAARDQRCLGRVGLGGRRRAVS